MRESKKKRSKRFIAERDALSKTLGAKPEIKRIVDLNSPDSRKLVQEWNKLHSDPVTRPKLVIHQETGEEREKRLTKEREARKLERTVFTKGKSKDPLFRLLPGNYGGGKKR
jgi:hypothetical protein